jgi:serine/threonine protein kinase
MDDDAVDPQVASVLHDLRTFAQHRRILVSVEQFRLTAVLARGEVTALHRATRTEPDGAMTEVAIREVLVHDGRAHACAQDYAQMVQLMHEHRHKPFTLRILGCTAKRPLWVVQPYCPEGALSAYTRADSARRLCASAKTAVAMGVAYGMERLHRDRVIHRNLKASNVVLERREQGLVPLIADFALARALPARANRLTRACGTVQWMAPEQMQSHAYGPKVDVYAYGMLLYEMLCNRMPFQGMSPELCVTEVAQGRRPDLPAGVEHAICKLIRRCWQGDPSKRPTFKKIWKAMANKRCWWEGTEKSVVDWIKEEAKLQNKNNKEKGKSKMSAGLETHA